MRRIRFTRGSAFLDVKIDNRVLEFKTPLLNDVPVKIDLDRLDNHKKDIKKMKMDKKILKELSNLKTEQDMVDDLMDDLKKSGWEVLDYGID